MKKKIVVGMSGGVDSSAAALMLKERGYDVIGVTLRLTDSDVSGTIDDARRVAQTIGIDHEVVDLREVFEREVIEYFTKEYLSGATPNPCVICNQKIKFGAMLDIAHGMGAEKIATGHYVRTVDTGDRILLCRSESLKDQSYFLSYLSQEQLRSAVFPLCDMQKDEIREKQDRRDFRLPTKRTVRRYALFLMTIMYRFFVTERDKFR